MCPKQSQCPDETDTCPVDDLDEDLSPLYRMDLPVMAEGVLGPNVTYHWTKRISSPPPAQLAFGYK